MHDTSKTDTYLLTLPILPTGTIGWQIDLPVFKRIEVKPRYRGFFTKIGKEAQDASRNPSRRS